MLSEVNVAFDIFYQHIVDVYRGVVYNHHLCLCDVHLKTHRIVIVASVVFLVVFLCIGIIMSSAKRILERNSPSIFTSLFFQFNLINPLPMSLLVVLLRGLFVLLQLGRCHIILSRIILFVP